MQLLVAEDIEMIIDKIVHRNFFQEKDCLGMDTVTVTFLFLARQIFALFEQNSRSCDMHARQPSSTRVLSSLFFLFPAL